MALNTPLTSIEKLYLFDSSDRFPNRITGRLLFDDRIDFKIAQAACFWLGERHPVLGCTIENFHGRLYWKRDPDLYRVEDAQAARESDGNFDVPICHWFHYVELQETPTAAPDFIRLLKGVEYYRPCMVIRSWPDHAGDRADAAGASKESDWRSEVWFSIHHAYCDGAGGVQIMNDWMEIYQNLINQREPEWNLSGLDERRFLTRNQLGFTSWKFIRNLPFQPIGLFGATKFVFRKTAGLSATMESGDKKSKQSVDAASAFESGWLDPDELRAVEEFAAKNNFNVNAKLLGDLYGVLFRWRQRFETNASPKQWMRIILPINLRDIGDRRLSAANRSSLIQVDRQPHEGHAAVGYYRSIQREIGTVLKFQLDRMFLIMIRLISGSSKLLQSVAQNPKPRGLAIFTNLGKPFRRLERRVANETHLKRGATQEIQLQPSEIDFLAPLRLGTPINFSVAKYLDRLRVTLHYDPLVIARGEAQNLLTDYLQSIRKIEP